MSRLPQIQAFKAELIALAEEGITLDEATLGRICAHHEALLTGAPDERLSLGMRIASLVGAVALSAAVFFLFYRFWGTIPTAGQVTLLIAVPPLLVAATHLLHGWEKSGYFATLAALTAFAAFVLDLTALGQLFNLPQTIHAFLAWGAFGLLLGVAYDLRLPHLAGAVCLGLWLAALPTTLRGEAASSALFVPEALTVVGLGYLAYAHFIGARIAPWRALDLRIVGMTGAFIALFTLSLGGETSRLPWDRDALEAMYQSIGLGVAAGTIWWGVRSGRKELVNGGMIFLTALLLVKATDWWWETLPRWVFFLVIAAMAIGILFLLKWVQGRAARRLA